MTMPVTISAVDPGSLAAQLGWQPGDQILAVNGETVEENLFTEHVAVTKDNIRTLYPETPAC